MLEAAHEYLRNSYCLATQSRDNSNQNGATLVSLDGEIIGTGVNNFPPGVKFTTERSIERPMKYSYFEHAERNAIYAAARAGKEVFGSTMYCFWAACSDCARSLICSGVRTLVVHKPRMSMTPARWHNNIEEALGMLKESGVTVQYYEKPIEAPDVLVNGELWNPNKEYEVAHGNYFVEMGVR